MSAPNDNTYAKNKRSIQAKAVAKEVQEKVSKGEKISMYRILLDHGYSHWIAKQPSRIINTKSFQEEIESIVGPMKEVRALAIAGMLEQAKSFHKLNPLTLAGIVSKLTHDIQLLAGSEKEQTNASHVSELSQIGDVLRKLRETA